MARAKPTIDQVQNLDTQLTSKQDKLVSGTNIKTINGETILGTGNIAVTSGVNDHGDLTGLSDDDHTQYHNDTRGDARYYTKTQVDTALSGKSDTTHNHTGVYEPANANIQTHISSTSNPHNVTAAQVGLGNVENLTFKDGIESAILGSTEKVTPADSDHMGIVDTVLKRIKWSSIKAALKTYFDTLYATVSHNHNGTYEPANANIQTHISSTSNPHSTTAAQVGAYTTTQTDTLLNAKQNTLVSGTNIKTINGNSVLGSGDLVISGGGSATLDGLTDVAITTPLVGQSFEYVTNDYPEDNPSYDQYYTNTICKLNFTGADLSTTITDSSFANLGNLTRSGVTISTEQFKWNGSSAKYSAKNQYILIPSGIGQYYGFLTNPFTIEMWAYPTNINGVNTFIFNTTGPFEIYHDATDFYVYYNMSSSVGTLLFSFPISGSGYTQDAWNHLAFSRTGDTFYFFVNGVQKATSTVVGLSINNPTGNAYLGRDNGTINGFIGYLDDVRITIGVGRYTANFTLPTAEFGDNSTPILHNYVNEWSNVTKDKLTIGDTSNPTGVTAYIKSSSSGRAWSPNQNLDLVLENQTITGINLIGGNASEQRIYFSDTDTEARGAIIYNHADDSLRFATSQQTALTMDSAGKLYANRTYTNTTANNPNIYIGLDGQIYRSTAVIGGGGSAQSVSKSTYLQSDLGLNKTRYWNAFSGNVTVQTNQSNTISATGTATVASFATTNYYTYHNRVEYLVTTASTSAIAGIRIAAAATYTCGGASNGLGGFFYKSRFGFATGSTISTKRGFIGMSSLTTAPTDVALSPSSLGEFVGVGFDSTDTNFQIVFCGSNQLMGKIDLGSNFPKTSTDRTKMYELSLYCAPGTTQSVEYIFRDLSSNISISGTITNGSATLPSTSTLLLPRGYTSVGGTSSQVGFALSSLYIEDTMV